MVRSIHLGCRIALAATTALAGRVWSQVPAEPQALRVTAENLMAGDERHRAIAARHGDPNVVMPGDVVRYRLAFTNLTPDSVRTVQFNDPLPAGLHYVAGSARSDRDDVAIEFSSDGGRTYSPQPMVQEVVDGKKLSRPVPPARYTHVRWGVRGWVKSHAQVTAEFSVQLPATPAPSAGGNQERGSKP